MAGRHLELREIDYTEVLRERTGGQPPSGIAWSRTACRASAFDLDDDAISELLGIAGDTDQLCRADVDGGEQDGDRRRHRRKNRRRSSGCSAASSTSCRKTRRTASNRCCRTWRRPSATCRRRCCWRCSRQRRSADEGAQVVQAVASRMSDRHDCAHSSRVSVIAAEHADRSASRRRSRRWSATAISRSGCWRSRARRRRVAARQHGRVRRRLEPRRRRKLLTSYSDEPFVSEEYGRELSGARTQGDRRRARQRRSAANGSARGWARSPPARCARSTSRCSSICCGSKQDDERWGELMTPVVGLLEDLLLVGDFDAAHPSCSAVLVSEARRRRVDGPPPGRDRPPSTCWSPAR